VRVVGRATVLALALIAVIGALAAAVSPARAAARLCAAGSGTTLGTVANPAIDELSGLVQSTAHPGVLWANNDSGDSARVFAVGSDGADLGTVMVSGATATDWEDLALGPGPGGGDHLYVGDLGGAGTSGNARHATGVPIAKSVWPDSRDSNTSNTVSNVVKIVARRLRPKDLSAAIAEDEKSCDRTPPRNVNTGGRMKSAGRWSVGRSARRSFQ